MKINLGVIFGGQTVEHEVSVISALQAIQNLNEETVLVSPITGEVIQVKELARVVGILEGLRDYPIWIVEDD